MKRYLQFVNGEFIDPLHSGPPRRYILSSLLLQLIWLKVRVSFCHHLSSNLNFLVPYRRSRWGL